MVGGGKEERELPGRPESSDDLVGLSLVPRMNGEEKMYQLGCPHVADSFPSGSPFLDTPDTAQKHVFHARREGGGFGGETWCCSVEYCLFHERENRPAKIVRLIWAFMVDVAVKGCFC